MPSIYLYRYGLWSNKLKPHHYARGDAPSRQMKFQPMTVLENNRVSSTGPGDSMKSTEDPDIIVESEVSIASGCL